MTAGRDDDNRYVETDAERAEEAEPASSLPNIPLLEDELEHGTLDAKPTWRGWIHAGTFPLTIVGGVVLIVVAQGTAAKWSAALGIGGPGSSPGASSSFMAACSRAMSNGSRPTRSGAR